MERISRVRAGIFLAIFIAIIAFFTLKLYNLQVVVPGGVVDNTKTFTTVTRVKAARGDILDCNGNVLVTNRASYDLVFNHYVILSAGGTNEKLLQLVRLCREQNIDYFDHFPVTEEAPFAYTLDEYNSTWQGYFQAFLPEKGGLDSDISAPLLMKKLRDSYSIPEDWSDADARAVIGLRYELELRGITKLPNYVFVEDASSAELASILELNIPGLKTEASTVRVYSTEYAAHILGYVGAMTKDQWEYYKALEGQSYSMDAQVGQAGFELAFEEYLHGTDGWRVDVTYVDGTLKEQYYQKDKDGKEQKPIAGKNVEVTIDLQLQRAAEDAMEELIAKLRASGEGEDGADVEGGAVVVMDTKTGRVLACASYPTYDPSTYFEDYNNLLEQPFAPLFNRALQAQYPPGSTYKMSTVIAGIDSGTVGYGTYIEDKGEFTKYAPFLPKCLRWSQSHRTHGYVTAVTALQDSCNYYFYDIADRMSLLSIDSTAKGLGLGEATGIELYEKLGYRANAENKKILYANSTEPGATNWYPADQLMASIGQSINQFTPMQLCVYTNTLANRGVRYKATFLDRVMSSDYRDLVYENAPEVLSTMEISDSAYRAYTEGMRAVVTKGTAKSIFGDYPVAVAAKTGTAQHSGHKDASDHGAFVCYAPYDDPEISIVVYGEKAGHGSTMGQIAKVILDAYYANAGDGVTGENQVS